MPTDEIAVLQSGWEKLITTLRPPRLSDPRKYVYASSRRKCLRRMVEEAIHPEYFPEYNAETKARFIRGDQREVDLRQALERVGQLTIPSFTVEGQQQRVQVFDRNGRLVIRGKIDCKIRWESGTTWPTEFKSWAPFLTEKIFTFQDLWNSPYTWSGAHQLLSYLFSENQPYGLLVLDRPGLPRLIKVSLEEAFALEGMEGFLQDATAVVDHIEDETLPDYHTDPKECKRCPIFGSACQPALSYAAAQIVVDDETIARVERFADLQGMSELKEFTELEEWIKERFRGAAGDKLEATIIAGKAAITVKWQKDTKYNVPKDVNEQIKQLKQPFAKKVEQGKCFVTVERLSE